MTTRAVASTIHRRKAVTAGTIGILASALGLGLSTAGPAHAAAGVWDVASAALPWVPTTAADGEISFALVDNANSSNAELVSYRRDGTRVQYATRLNAGDLAWSPGGDEVVTVPQGSQPAQPTGSTLEHLSNLSRPSSSLWSPFGDSTVSSTASPYQSVAQWVARNQSDALTPTQTVTPGAGAVTPNASATVVRISPSAGTFDLGSIPATLPRQGNAATDMPPVAPTPLGYSALSPDSPVVSNGGALAFVGTSGTGPAIYVDEGHGPVAVAALGELCPGTQRPTFSPSGRSLAYVTSSGGCTASELHVLDMVGNTFVGGTDSTVVTSAATNTTLATYHFANPSWRPSTPAAASLRLSGADRIATGIAVSQWGWPNGSQGAIIANSDNFPDALVAGPLSGAADYPLLLTGQASLDSRDLAELKRLMPTTTSRFVYIIGSTGMISDGVRATLANNGFQVVRLAGADRYGTSVAVAQELDQGYSGTNPPPRTTVVLADGTNFPDALSAAPAAAIHFAPVLLTYKTTVPTVVKNYIDSHTNFRTVDGIGRNAAGALGVFGTRAGEGIFGADRFETSAKVAQRFFPGAGTAGYASGLTFPDGLTGGALMSVMAQPLMLVSPTSVPTSVGSQAALFRPSTDQVLSFGGPSVLSESVRTALTGYAGTQTALWGPDVAQATNPLYPPAPATATGGTTATMQPNRLSSNRTIRPTHPGSTSYDSFSRVSGG